jgi:hypothetical protein
MDDPDPFGQCIHLAYLWIGEKRFRHHYCQFDHPWPIPDNAGVQVQFQKIIYLSISLIKKTASWWRLIIQFID